MLHSAFLTNCDAPDDCDAPGHGRAGTLFLADVHAWPCSRLELACLLPLHVEFRPPTWWHTHLVPRPLAKSRGTRSGRNPAVPVANVCIWSTLPRD